MKATLYTSIAFFCLALSLSSCGDNKEEQPNTLNTTENSQSNKDKNNQSVKMNTGKSDGSRATSPSDLTEEEIQSLYNDPRIDINGLSRLVNTLSAFEYVRAVDQAKTSSKFFVGSEFGKGLLTEKEKIVVLIPSNDYLESTGRTRIPEALLSSSDDLIEKAMYGHIFELKGKYIGGDFIVIENLANQRQNRITKQDGVWKFKHFTLGEPALVRNGIVFIMQGDQFPEPGK